MIFVLWLSDLDVLVFGVGQLEDPSVASGGLVRDGCGAGWPGSRRSGQRSYACEDLIEQVVAVGAG
jgi:hypothetical protein